MNKSPKTPSLSPQRKVEAISIEIFGLPSTRWRHAENENDFKYRRDLLEYLSFLEETEASLCSSATISSLAFDLLPQIRASIKETRRRLDAIKPIAESLKRAEVGR